MVDATSGEEQQAQQLFDSVGVTEQEHVSLTQSVAWCPICDCYIPQDCLIEHCSSCQGNNNDKSTECCACFRQISNDRYVAHVEACASQLNICNSCSKFINDKDLLRSIPCPDHHQYCLPCIQRQLTFFIQHELPPVCHPEKCPEYLLSQYDLRQFPLERKVYNRLKKLIKGKHRAQCVQCLFYYDELDGSEDEDHQQTQCELIPCEFCACPYNERHIDEHSRQCRQDNDIDHQRIEFIARHAKYPCDYNKLEYLYMKRKQNGESLEIIDIINMLAEFGPIFPLEMPTRICDICVDTYPYGDIFVFDCDLTHKSCYSCYHQSCQVKMQNNEVLTCPMCPGYRLMDGELNQLRLPPNDVHRFKDYQMRQTFKMYSQSTRGIIKCPAEGCAWIAEAQNPEERIRVQCPMCHKEFCSLCNQQYHYRTQCQAIPALTQQWFLWCDKERGEYLTARDRQDAAYAKQMAIYTRHQETNKQQIRELATRYRELLADEKYKAANCRHCPQCRRVVEKLGGCEQMVCGQDADGGNNQSGCGHKFVWEKAPVYDAQIKTSSQPVLLKHPGRRARQAVGHQHRALDRNKGGSLNQPIIQESEELLHHKGAKCDACQEDIKGIKFDCIHCPALSFCEKCEQEQTLQHYNENNLKGQQQHVFKLITKLDEQR